MEQGVSGVKMKVGALSIRERCCQGKGCAGSHRPLALLMLDANCAYSSHRADPVCQAGGGIRYLPSEEPVAPRMTTAG